MKKILIIILLLICANLVFTQFVSSQPTQSRTQFEETDGDPFVIPYKVIVDNDSLTDNGDGTASLNTGSDSGSVKWNEILDPDNDQALDMGSFHTSWSSDLSTGTTILIQRDATTSTTNQLVTLKDNGNPTSGGTALLYLDSTDADLFLLSSANFNVKGNGNLTATAATFSSINNTEGNMTNVGNISLDSLSADSLGVDVNLTGSSTSYFAVFNPTDSYRYFFVRGNSRKIGLGTSAPQVTLDVVGTIQTRVNYLLPSDGDIGIGSGKALIEFEDESTDNINLMNANVGIGNTEPRRLLEVAGTISIIHGGNNGGSLGIGTTAPAASLDITATGSSSAALSLNIGSAVLTATNAGKVGIGTSSPGSLLTINGTTEIGSGTGVTFSAASGVITFAGVGGVLNENFSIDFESSANQVKFTSSSGARLVYNMVATVGDDSAFGFGNNAASGDSGMAWSTTGNDSLQLRTVVNSSTATGYFSIVEHGDINTSNRAPTSLAADPTLRIYSSDGTQAADYVEFDHDQTNANIRVGNGNLNITASKVGIGNTNARTKLEVSGTISVINGGGNGGRIGIGNTAPSASLQITATGSSSAALGLDVNSGSLSVTNAGKVGVGNTAPVYSFDVTGTAGFNGLSATGAGDTYVCLSTANELRTGATCAASTKKVKKRIHSLEPSNWISQLKPISFSYREGYYAGLESIGFLAEDLFKISPLLTFQDEFGDPYAVRWEAIATLVVQEIQILKKQNEALVNRLNALEGKKHGYNSN